jgi:hypothetical protein
MKLTPEQRIEAKKLYNDTLKAISECEANKRDKSFIYGCVKNGCIETWGQMKWFFWQSFLSVEGKRRVGITNLFNCLPDNVRKQMLS